MSTVLCLKIAAPNIGRKQGASDERIARRRARSFVVNGHDFTWYEFSLMSALNADEILKAFVSSKKSSEKRIADQILRIAACLQMATSQHGPYSVMKGRH